jgi:hypothetical protein
MPTKAEVRMGKIAKDIEDAAAKSKEPRFVDEQEALSWTDSPPSGRNWALRWVTAILVVGVVLMLLSCTTVEPKRPKPVVAIPKDVKLICFKGAWTVYSESASQGATFNHAPCGRDAI